MTDRHGFHLENVERPGRDHDPRGLLQRYLRQRALDTPELVVAADATGASTRCRRWLGERRGSRLEAGERGGGAPSRSSRPERARLALDSEALAMRSDYAGKSRRLGAAASARPGQAAAPDRVLRHLEHPGAADRRLDGRHPGRPARGRLPQFAVRGLGGQDDFAAMAEVGLAPLRAPPHRRRPTTTRVRDGPTWS